MTLVIKTPDDSPDSVEVVGIGVLPARGVGGQLVDKFAASCVEFQTPTGVPLEGKELKAAAEAFAEARGLVVANVKTTADELAIASGAYVDKPADQVAVDEFDRTLGGLNIAPSEDGVQPMQVIPSEDGAPPPADPKPGPAGSTTTNEKGDA